MITTTVECAHCGLYPDEHCDQCDYCPGWHEIDCENGLDPELSPYKGTTLRAPRNSEYLNPF
jgi:hypothetical protein